MKRVLVLAYYFPPLGGVGAQRPVKFVKYLSESGYEPIVVTGPENNPVEWAPADTALAADVPSDLRVLRTAAPPPFSSGARHRVDRWFGLWSPFHRWWRREAVRVGRTVVADVDLVFAMMSPFSTAAAAEELAKSAGKPWVADLQDPWALDEWIIHPTALHGALERYRMRRDLRSAATVIMVTEEATRAVLTKFPEFRSSRVLTIPWGWDPIDYDGRSEERDSAFRVVYAGYSHVERGERHRARRRLREAFGGAVRGMDILPRSHVFLLAALTRVHEVDPELTRRFELHLAGPVPPPPGLHETEIVPVIYHGYLPHDEAIGLMQSADVLFLSMHDLPGGLRARTVPAKTYEYIASGRPILGALPDGDARDLLTGLPNAWLCRPTDVNGMATALREIAASKHIEPPAPDFVQQFEWRRLTRRLARIFDEVLSDASARG